MMDSSLPVLMIVGFVIFAVAAVIFGLVQAARRRQRFAEWANKRGWAFSGSRKDYVFEHRYNFDCFARGERDRYAFNIVEGEARGRPMQAFDYHYATTSHNSKGGSQTHHHYFSAVMVKYAGPLKPLKIRRETFFDKVANFFGRNAINFESAEFSKQFHVEAPDRKWAYDVIHGRTMKLLMRSPAYEIQMQGPWVIAAKKRTMDMPQFDKAIKVVNDLLDGLPQYVQQDMQGSP
ncbi:MAG: hypothetical protein WD294_07610 [Phycisphaeraceae bacterium]